MSFGVLALISWLATASFGGFLLYWWVGRVARAVARARLKHSRPPPYIPRLLVVAHVGLAVVGLAAWTFALTVSDDSAYAVPPTLLVVALIGVSMFTRWLGSRRARRAAAHALHRAPSESRLPTVVVIGHGLLGVATVLLVVISYFRPARI